MSPPSCVLCAQPWPTAMFERFKAWLLRVIRVPAQPRPPASDQHIRRVFRAAPNFWRYKLVLWLLKQVAAVCGLVFGLGFVRLFAASTPFDAISLLLFALEYIA